MSRHALQCRRQLIIRAGDFGDQWWPHRDLSPEL